MHIVCDIDGVLADASHREHLLPNWEAFFSAAWRDPPLLVGVQLLRSVSKSTRVTLLTGRPERLRGATEKWLKRQKVPYDSLLMRPDGDRRPAATFKVMAIENLDDPADLVIDDSEKVCRSMRAAGFATVLWL